MMGKIQAAQGCYDNGVFSFPVRIYYEDTDAGGIVYYANYLKFAERARSEFLRFLGIDQQKDLEENGSGFVVRSCHIEYLQSAVLNDDLTVTCRIADLGAVRAVIHQKIMRGDAVLAELEVKVVYMNVRTHRPTRIPQMMVDKLTSV